MNIDKKTTLIDSLKSISNLYPQFRFVPVNGKKQCIITGWEKGFTTEETINFLINGYDGINKEGKSFHTTFKGFGLLTGELSGYILAIDCDGNIARQKAEDLGGLPYTPSWTSGKDGCSQRLYLVPPEYREIVAKFTKSDANKGCTSKQELGIRYNGCYSVMYPSEHPETPGYIPINSFESTPIAELPTWVIEKILEGENKPSNPDQLPLKFNQLDEPIPLIQCLSVEYRNLIKSGLGFDCGRNPMGFKIAVDALGCELRLQHLGIPYTGTAKDLLDEFHGNSDKKEFTQKHIETIYKSAQKSNPTPCLSDDKLENCYKAWQRQHHQTHQQTSNKPNHQTSGNNALKPEFEPEKQSNVLQFQQRQHQPNIEDLETELREIAEKTQSKSKEKSDILKLSKKFNFNPKNIEEQLQLIKDENEEKDSLDDIKSELGELQKNRNQSLDLTQYLPGNLAKIGEFANRLCLRPELSLSAFLTTCSSLLAVGTMIDLMVDYCQFDQKSLGMYTAICAEPSQKKSPLINKIALEPLLELQEEARKQYEQEMVNYQVDYADWVSDKNNPDPEPKKPIMRRFFISGGTQAGIRNVLNTHSANGWGLLVLTDELAASYKNNGKTYNAGLLEDFLTYYDGYGKSEALNEGFKGDFSQCLVSMLGGIQPGVISEYMNGSDGNGHWSRVSVVNQPISPFLIPDNLPGKLDFKPMLVDFYKKLSQLSRIDLTLDTKAKTGFIVLNNKCETYRVTAKSQALASLWGKMPGKIGRFAALLHIIEQVWEHGTVQTLVVGKATLDMAAKLAKFYYHESYSLYSDCSQDKSDLAPQLMKILTLAEKQQKAIGASDVKRFDREMSKLSPDDIRAMFTQLVELGYGELEGKGCSLKFKNIQIIDNNRQIIDKIVDAETTMDKEVQPIIDRIDKKIENFQNEPETTYMGDFIHIEGEPENPKHGENLSIPSINPSNPDTEGDTASTDLSINRLFLSIIPETDDYGERPPEPTPKPEPGKLDEMVKAEPLPSLINMATRIDFDSLVAGETIFDSNDKPYTLKQKGYWNWLTTDGYSIDSDNIGNFHRK